MNNTEKKLEDILKKSNIAAGVFITGASFLIGFNSEESQFYESKILHCVPIIYSTGVFMGKNFNHFYNSVEEKYNVKESILKPIGNYAIYEAIAIGGFYAGKLIKQLVAK